MAEKMNLAYKKGDINNCKKVLTDSSTLHQERSAYCSGNFSEDFNKFNDCLKEDDFCNFCCENEFGEMQIEERGQCMKELCTPKTEKGPGVWIWAHKIE